MKISFWVAAAAALLTSSACHSTGNEARDHSAEPVAAPHSGADALATLMEGNLRFVGGATTHQHQTEARREELVAGQHPIATILSCSDSRAPVEILFDQGLGDVFVVRVAGNVVGTNELGSIEYAVQHLHTPLVLVLGHESCGAVTAALSPAAAQQQEAPEVQALLNAIAPALTNVDAALAPNERVHLGVEANVNASVRRLMAAPELHDAHAGDPPRIVGAVYELATGKVRLLPALPDGGR